MVLPHETIEKVDWHCANALALLTYDSCMKAIANVRSCCRGIVTFSHEMLRHVVHVFQSIRARLSRVFKGIQADTGLFVPMTRRRATHVDLSCRGEVLCLEYSLN